MLEVAFSKTAIRVLKKIRAPTCGKIVSAILAYAADSSGRRNVTALKKTGTMRLRVGAYRVIFKIVEDNDAETMAILFVGHRKDIYRRLK